MAADKPRPTLADYVTIVASPALIVALIVSLVFFLLAIFYRGEYVGRLHYVFFFFIFGIVLVARISMEAGVSERAPFYGIVLAVLVWLGMRMFVSYPADVAAASWLINAGLIGLAWWLAYQLTYSCTYLDEQAESTGTGLLQAAGMEKLGDSLRLENQADELVEKNGKRAKKPKITWWGRYKHFRAEQKKTQPPGVWVVYFALAALPIFGLGQALIDPADAERRTHTFWLMALYLASSLGLLGTTAFLGLRRYLRQRRLEMPKRVTMAWLVLGAVLVAALVGIAALLPRPQSEFSVLTLSRAGSQELAASQHALAEGDQGEGEGRPGARQRDADGNPTSRSDKDSEGKGGKGQAKGQGSGSKAAQQGAGKGSSKKAGETRDGQTSQNKERKGEASTDGDRAPPHSTGDSPEASSLSWLSQAASVLKWIVFAILALIAIAFVLGGGLKYLAHFTDWAHRLLEALRRLWEGLLGGRRDGKAGDNDIDERPQPPPAPFRSFVNPFHSGRAERMTPADLVRYSFEALEAWAGERQMGRHADESPIEFTHRLAGELPALEEEAQGVGVLYARVLYARGELPADWRETLQRFWKRLDTVPSGGTAVSFVG
jgi:hypothetical protein